MSLHCNGYIATLYSYTMFDKFAHLRLLDSTLSLFRKWFRVRFVRCARVAQRLGTPVPLVRRLQIATLRASICTKDASQTCSVTIVKATCFGFPYLITILNNISQKFESCVSLSIRRTCSRNHLRWGAVFLDLLDLFACYEGSCLDTRKIFSHIETINSYFSFV